MGDLDNMWKREAEMHMQNIPELIYTLVTIIGRSRFKLLGELKPSFLMWSK